MKFTLFDINASISGETLDVTCEFRSLSILVTVYRLAGTETATYSLTHAGARGTHTEFEAKNSQW